MPRFMGSAGSAGFHSGIGSGSVSRSRLCCARPRGLLNDAHQRATVVELDPTFSAGGGGPSGTDYRGVSSILHGHNHSEYQSRVMIALSLHLLTPTVPRSGSFFVHFRNQPHTRVADTTTTILSQNEQVQCSKDTIAKHQSRR